MKNICTKCAHHKKGKWSVDLCYAPWPKTLDHVSGKLTPPFEKCEVRNRLGVCVYFKPEWYVRVWNFFLDDIFRSAK